MKQTPIRNRRTKPRPGRLQGAELMELRRQCWARDKGLCQNCGRKTRFRGLVEADSTYHMAHIKVKRLGGDNLLNVQTLCGRCHRLSHQYGPSGVKPCPPKGE